MRGRYIDLAQLKALRESGYTIPKQCQLCKHGRFGEDVFGICLAREYKPLGGEPRELGVYAFGGCDDLFELRQQSAEALEGWAEFVDRREFTRSTRHKAKTQY